VNETTLQQKMTWHLGNIASDPSALNLLWVVNIEGAATTHLLRMRLQQALSELQQRHESLRTAFFHDHGELRAVRVVRCLPDLEVENASTVPARVRSDRAIDFGLAPYDLEVGETCRFRLVQTGPKSHQLYCGFHHLVIDGVSWRVFLRHLVDEIAGIQMVRPGQTDSPFGPEPCRKQNAIQLSASVSFWQSKFKTPNTPLAFPSDRPRANRPESNGSHVEQPIPPQLFRRLSATSLDLGHSPFRIVFAAYSLWLSRTTGNVAPRIATILAGRRKDESSGLLGLFNQTVFVDIASTPGLTFRALVDRLSIEIDACIDHEETPPFAALQEIPTAGHSFENPYSRASFVRQPSALRFDFDGLVLTDERVFLPRTGRDLGVYFQQTGEAAKCTWMFRTSAFDEPTIWRASLQLNHILRQICTDPERILDTIEVVPPFQRQMAIQLTKGEARDYPLDTPLHRIIEKQAQKTPMSIAVVCKGVRLTYRDVDAKANRIAQWLVDRGVQQGDFLPILMPSSSEMLLAELATLKIGAVFVPLDPAWPKARIRDILARLGAPIVVVRKGAAETALLDGINILEVGRSNDIAGVAGQDFGTDIAGDHPVYCIFTSGSTGAPKGALNANRGVVNRLFAMSDILGSGEDHVILASAPPAVDTLVWQFFWPLIIGGRCVIFPTPQALTAKHVAEICAAENVTVLDFVPSVFQGFSDALLSEPCLGDSFTALKTVLIGGEAMRAGPVNAFLIQFPGIDVFNSYGPTEASISAIWFKVPPGITAPIPIGRPLSNIAVVILKPDGEVATAGQVGELCLAGACVGLGYFNDPVQTAACFVDAPEPLFGNRTMYRTGDLARAMPHGVIEFIGRQDDQISLNGVRIEPGEVEAALSRHPDISDAGVVLRVDGGERPVLTAYIVAKEGRTPAADELRGFLLSRLPRSFVPGAVFSLNALPRDASGKLNRATLRTISRGTPLRLEPDRHSTLDSSIADILSVWNAVFRRADIGPQDDFFLDLSGDSLLALQCTLKLEERLGLRLELHDFYVHSTPAALAQHFRDLQKASADRLAQTGAGDVVTKMRVLLNGWKGQQAQPDSMLFTLNAGGQKRRLFWCCQGFNELERLAVGLGPEHPVTGMRSGSLLMDYNPDNVRTLANQYANEISALAPKGGLVLGGYCQATIIVREVAEILRSFGHKIDLTIFLEDVQFTACAGPVALIYGSDSHINPDVGGVDSRAFLREKYRDGFKMVTLPGTHNSIYSVENTAELGAAMRRFLVQSRLGRLASFRPPRWDSLVAKHRHKSAPL
jgi:amino acid adenylation domain-containing protein